MSRAEKGIWKCNGSNQHFPRDVTFSKWLLGRKSDRKTTFSRCNACYDNDEEAEKEMARATTNMVMHSQTSSIMQAQIQETVSSSPQATQVNISCPQ